jgi:hypothetical protein
MGKKMGCVRLIWFDKYSKGIWQEDSKDREQISFKRNVLLMTFI